MLLLNRMHGTTTAAAGSRVTCSSSKLTPLARTAARHCQRRPCCNTTSLRRPLSRRAVSCAPRAYSSNNSSSQPSSSGDAAAGRLRVLVVGANPAGLAAAVSLAQQVLGGCAVEVHDSRPDPRHNNTGGGNSLVALGKRGLQALSHLNLTKPLPGLTLLEGMVVVSSGGQVERRERFSRPQQQGGALAAATGGMTTPGIAAIDELALTSHLLSAAAALSEATGSSSEPPQLVLQGSPSAGTATSAGGLTPTVTTPVPQGPTSATSAEAAQEAALPPTIPAPGTANAPANWGVQVHYGSRLALLDAANKQATFMCAGGQASIVRYDLCIAADPAGGGELVASALRGLQDRQAAHKHPAQAAAAAAAHKQRQHDVSELEFKAWQDMPHDPQPAGLVSGSSASSSSRPRQGQLLVWTAAGGSLPQRTHPDLSSAAAAGSGTAIIPGAPSCTVMAWPSNSGAGTWSGCVFTSPQVFEALRSQDDYVRLLASLSSGPAAPTASGVMLPPQWVQGIAAQLKHSNTVGSLSPTPAAGSPSAGLVVLSAAAAPAQTPQLLNPGVSVGLAEADALAASVADSVAVAGGTARVDVFAQAVERSLSGWDATNGPEARALHKLTAQLSWLRHPFSPAAAAAAASVPWFSLAWLCGLFSPRWGLDLQWKCLAAVLPLVAAVQRALPQEAAPVAAAGGAAQGGGVSGGHSLADVAAGVQPCGASLLSFLHTTSMRPSGVWRLLQAAPLIVFVLCGALFWAAAQAVRWGCWALRAWGWAQSGVA